MKLLTDENIATSVVKALKKAGFDVKDIKEQNLHGTFDNEIIRLAYKEDRIILTHDKILVTFFLLRSHMVELFFCGSKTNIPKMS